MHVYRRVICGLLMFAGVAHANEDCWYQLPEDKNLGGPSLLGKQVARYSAVGYQQSSNKSVPATLQLAAAMPTMTESAFPTQEKYGKVVRNPIERVADHPVSTFSLDVDTGSYSNIRRFLHDGILPPKDAVRIEEMLNYFPYQRMEKNHDPLSVYHEVVDSPWQQSAKLLRIMVDSQTIDLAHLPPANLVFLVDVSGSMNHERKLPLVQTTLCLLTKKLRPQDKVSIITYASGEKLVLPATPGNEQKKIMAVIDNLHAGGATAGEAAIQMAYKEAKKSFRPQGINRILLATDGDFNVGITDFAQLKALAAEKRKTGIALTTLGYGTGNYNDQLMEQLADAGDGSYHYIDSRLEAEKVMHSELSATLNTVAKNAKIQVEFNPATVKEYRLIGYENRQLREEDFNHDTVDAGEVGAGHQVTALYEFIPVGQQGWLDDRRYASKSNSPSGNTAEYGIIKLRYQVPNTSSSNLIKQPILSHSMPLYQATDDTRFAVAVAGFGQILADDSHIGTWQYQDVLRTAQSALGQDHFGLRKQFVDLVKKAEAITKDESSTER